MRDDQILNLIRKEIGHMDNVCLLRNQQVKIMLDSIVSALCEPWLLFKCLFQPYRLRERIDQIYIVKAQLFNEQMKEATIKEKIKV